MSPPRKPSDAELAPADQVPTKRAAPKKAAAKKVAAKKVAAAKKAPARKVGAKKVAPAEKAAAKRAAARSKKGPAKRVAPAVDVTPAEPLLPPDDGWSDVWDQDDPQVPGWELDEPRHEVDRDADEDDFGPDEDDDDFGREDDDEPGFGASSPLDDPRVQAGLDRIQRAAHEFIAGSRALLDVAEELVEDPKAAGGLASMLGELGHAATRLARNAARSGFAAPWTGGGPGGGDPDGEDPDDDPPVQRIPVS